MALISLSVQILARWDLWAICQIQDWQVTGWPGEGRVQDDSEILWRSWKRRKQRPCHSISISFGRINDQNTLPGSDRIHGSLANNQVSLVFRVCPWRDHGQLLPVFTIRRCGDLVHMEHGITDVTSEEMPDPPPTPKPRPQVIFHSCPEAWDPCHYLNHTHVVFPSVWK